MQTYLEQDYGWEGVRLAGWIRRSRMGLHGGQWQSRERTTWISSLSFAVGTPDRIAEALKGHWTVENGVFYVRDVSYGEDRYHGRRIAQPLSIIRNVAINLIRQKRYAFIPDGWRDVSSKPDKGLSLLLTSLDH
jgi:hypothetical protein